MTTNIQSAARVAVPNNVGVIFRRTLRDSQRGIIGWSLGMALLAAFMLLFYPLIMTKMEVFQEMLESPLVRAFLGAEVDFATPEGYVGVYVMTYIPVVLAFYVVLLALNITAGEEERGTADILLVAPVPRWRVVVEKFLALTVIVIVVLIVAYLGTLLGMLVTPEVQVPAGRLAEGYITMLPLMLVMGAGTLFFSTITRSRATAGSLAGALVVGSYFLNALASMADESIQWIRKLSFFSYYGTSSVLNDGIVWGDVLVLTVITLVLFGLALWFFQRRDLAV